jgi:hypothetical protein
MSTLGSIAIALVVGAGVGWYFTQGHMRANHEAYVAKLEARSAEVRAAVDRDNQEIIIRGYKHAIETDRKAEDERGAIGLENSRLGDRVAYLERVRKQSDSRANGLSKASACAEISTESARRGTLLGRCEAILLRGVELAGQCGVYGRAVVGWMVGGSKGKQGNLER